MATQNDLLQTLKRIDGRGYKAYKDIRGDYSFPAFQLFVDYVQGDPFATPSLLRVRVPAEKAGFPQDLYYNRIRRVALQDFLTRAFSRQITTICRQRRGSGKSGIIQIDSCGQEIIERTAMVVTDEYVEARFSAGLPARGRTVLGREAEEMFLREIPAMVKGALYYKSLDARKIALHVDIAEDQEKLRSILYEKNWMVFMANGSVLPRKSGVSDLPLSSSDVVPFTSPVSMEAEVELPHRGKIKGMAVPEGVTLIVGGGYHGKSTLLHALERGVYNHIPGDGREYIVSREDAVKIRAEDGRKITRVNISPFIKNLPQGIDTVNFSTEDASGSTSQAANIMEALEVGTSLLLIDEDTSATNFMIRDRRMQALVSGDKEPITPFIDKIRLLFEEKGVSTIIVVGGSGDYFDVADMVVMMDEYRPHEVTAEAKKVADEIKTHRKPDSNDSFGTITGRIISPNGLEPRKGDRIKITARGLKTIQYGTRDINLSYVEQLVDYSQTRAIGEIVYYIYRKGYLDGKSSLHDVLEDVLQDLQQNSLDVLSPYRDRHPGNFALPRKYEIAAAINRL